MLSLKLFKSNELLNSSLKSLLGGEPIVKATSYTVNGGSPGTDTCNYDTCKTTYEDRHKIDPTNDPNMCGA